MPYKDPVVRKEKSREYSARWVKENPERVKAYTKAHRERRAEANRKYKEANPEKVAAAKRAWFDANPAYLQGYYVRNRAKYMLAMARRRAAKAGVPFSLTEADIEMPAVCPVLGIEIRVDARGGFNPHSPSVDRLVPALGYVPGNVRVISNRANLLKRDATLDELRALVAYVERETS